MTEPIYNSFYIVIFILRFAKLGRVSNSQMTGRGRSTKNYGYWFHLKWQ